MGRRRVIYTAGTMSAVAHTHYGAGFPSPAHASVTQLHEQLASGVLWVWRIDSTEEHVVLILSARAGCASRVL